MFLYDGLVNGVKGQWLSDWLIVCSLMPFSTVFKLYCGASAPIYPCFPGVLLTSTSHNILSKPLAACQHNHCWWERNESCRNDYHQSSERILAKPGIGRGSNQRPPVLKSAMLPTELWGLAQWLSESLHSFKQQNFILIWIESVCRQYVRCDSHNEIVFERGGGKRRIC